MNHSDTVQKVKENLKLTYYPAEFPGFTRESREKHDLAMEVIEQLKFILQLDHPKEVKFSFSPHHTFIGYDALTQLYMSSVDAICNVIYGREPLAYQFPMIKGEILKAILPDNRTNFEYSHNPILEKIEKKVSEITTKYFDEWIDVREFRDDLEQFKNEYQSKSDAELENHKQRLIAEITKRVDLLDGTFSDLVGRFDTFKIKSVPNDKPQVMCLDVCWNEFNTIDKYRFWFNELAEFAESQKQKIKVRKPFEDEPQYLKDLLNWGMKCEPNTNSSMRESIFELLDDTYQYGKTIRLLRAKIKTIDEILLNDKPVQYEPTPTKKEFIPRNKEAENMIASKEQIDELYLPQIQSFLKDNPKLTPKQILYKLNQIEGTKKPSISTISRRKKKILDGKIS